LAILLDSCILQMSAEDLRFHIQTSLTALGFEFINVQTLFFPEIHLKNKNNLPIGIIIQIKNDSTITLLQGTKTKDFRPHEFTKHLSTKPPVKDFFVPGNEDIKQVRDVSILQYQRDLGRFLESRNIKFVQEGRATKLFNKKLEISLIQGEDHWFYNDAQKNKIILIPFFRFYEWIDKKFRFRIVR